MDLKLSKNFVTSSSHELQDLFLLSYENSTIENSEFSVLSEELMPKIPDFSYKQHNFFSLEEMNDTNIIYNDPHSIKLYPKNISESPSVDRNQKKMKYKVIFSISEFSLFSTSADKKLPQRTNRQMLLPTISTLNSPKTLVNTKLRG